MRLIDADKLEKDTEQSTEGEFLSYSALNIASANEFEVDKLLEDIDTRIQELIKEHANREAISELASISLKIQQMLKQMEEE